MGRYGVELNKGTTSTTIGVGSIAAPGSGMRRVKLYDLIFGSEAAPADNVFKVLVKRTTTANTGTSVTPRPLDPADAAAVTLALENLSAEGTSSDEVTPAFPLNQRATFRWVAAPGSEIVVPATANNGLVVSTPVAAGTPAATCGLMFEEQ
jgi:hypothetical protein